MFGYLKMPDIILSLFLHKNWTGLILLAPTLYVNCPGEMLLSITKFPTHTRTHTTVKHDASNIKVVSWILTAVKVFFPFSVETHINLRAFLPNCLFSITGLFLLISANVIRNSNI